MTGDYSTELQQWQASRPGPKFLVCQAGSQLLKLQGGTFKGYFVLFFKYMFPGLWGSTEGRKEAGDSCR